MKNKNQNIIRHSVNGRNRSHQKPIARKTVDEKKNLYQVLEKYQSLIIFLFAFLLYSNTLNHSFVLDDGLMIKENQFTLKGFRGITDILTHDQLGGQLGSEASSIYQGGRYRPLSQVMFAMEMQFFKLKPFYWHLIHVLLYSLLCVLVFMVLKRIFINIKSDKWYLSLPFIATVLYVAHPLHTEVSANVKSADEILCMMGAMLSLYFSLQYVDKKKIASLLGSFLCFLFGIFSKENAVTFIAVVPLTIFFFRKADLKTHLMVVLPMLLASAFYFLVRYITVGFSADTVEVKNLFHNPFMYASVSERYATILLTWLKYLLLLVFPHPLTHDYYPKQIPIINWSDFRAILSVVIYVILILFSLISFKRKNIAVYGILFFLITFSVTSNLVFNLGLFMNERFMFIPSLGYILIIAFLFLKGYAFLKQKASQNGMLVILILTFFLYSAKTISRNKAWKSDFILYTTDVQTSINSGRCNVIAGSLIADKARSEKDTTSKAELYLKASDYLKHGLNIYDRNAEGWNCLGEVSIYLSKYDEAENAITQALLIDSTNTTALNNLFYVGRYYQDHMLPKKAMKVYQFLNDKNPSVKYLYNMAIAYKEMESIDSAIVMLDSVILIQPDYYDAYNLAAEYFAQSKNNLVKALDYLERAYDKNKNYPSTLENLGILYGLKADYSKSLSYFEMAAKVDSTNPSVYNNLARTYEEMGKVEKARECLDKAAKYSGNK